MKGGTYPEQRIPAGCTQTLVVEDGQAIVRATTASSVDPTLDIDSNDVEVRGVTVTSNNVKRKVVHIAGDRVRLSGMDIGNVQDDKALEVWGDDVRIQDSHIHNARLVTPGQHLEGVFVVGAQRLHLTGNRFEGNGVYDVAFTRCTWCSPEGLSPAGGVIEDNFFGLTHQQGGSTWHYAELAFYPYLDAVRDFTVRRNHFETANSSCGGSATVCGGVLQEAPWVGGVRCGNTEGPVQGVIGQEWKQPC
jgi:hypothetical protein